MPGREKMPQNLEPTVITQPDGMGFENLDKSESSPNIPVSNDGAKKVITGKFSAAETFVGDAISPREDERKDYESALRDLETRAFALWSVNDVLKKLLKDLGASPEEKKLHLVTEDSSSLDPEVDRKMEALNINLVSARNVVSLLRDQLFKVKDSFPEFSAVYNIPLDLESKITDFESSEKEASFAFDVVKQSNMDMSFVRVCIEKARKASIELNEVIELMTDTKFFEVIHSSGEGEDKNAVGA